MRYSHVTIAAAVLLIVPFGLVHAESTSGVTSMPLRPTVKSGVQELRKEIQTERQEVMEENEDSKRELIQENKMEREKFREETQLQMEGKTAEERN